MPRLRKTNSADGLACLHPVVRRWFTETFSAPTDVQSHAWPAIAASRHTLLLAPTGSGKTLAAFLVALDRLIFPRSDSTSPSPPAPAGVRTLYVSPLKALGVDVALNLQRPLAGILECARRENLPSREPRIAIRTGDTPASERARFPRQPPDILITTPESLYLLLTSKASRALASVDTVIVDEIHSLVANKRGAHLFVTLERLEQLRLDLRDAPPPLQRIGLSATQRPLDEVARLLGGAEFDATDPAILRPRSVEIIAAGARKVLDLRIEMPALERMQSSKLVGHAVAPPTERSPTERPAASDYAPVDASAPPTSQWFAIYPELVEQIRAHRSTMLFVNSRRLAERLAAAINETAKAPLALAHHGSLARDQRQHIEQRLKSGDLPAIVATSSLELGIDMGAVDLVIQVAAPPSIAAGLQRIGRAGHQVGVPSKGLIFPKYRGDLLACAAAAARMTTGEVEETFYPRNPLDVLAQQVVAMVSLAPRRVEQLYSLVRKAAPFHDLPRTAFDGVLDMLAGRYPSDDFSELRPRVTWDRIAGIVTARQGAQRLAIANAGTIPDRGLYGVFLADHQGAGARVGELDEEMVFETKAGDVILLGASSWEVREITNDRVLVVPAPGAVARLPFWRGDGPGRPLEFGRAIGRLARQLAELPASAARKQLTSRHGLQRDAADQLIAYIREQVSATRGPPPSDESVVVECFRDEVGDWRIALLSPFGLRVHAPWALAAAARLRQERPGEHDVIWDDDGIVFRVPASDDPPPLDWLIPKADDVEATVLRELAGSSLFAARFRENAGRALLLPRRQPGRRTPLWLQRRRSADLLQTVARYPEFPILIETYRECVRDVFDLAGLKSLLGQIESRAIQVRQVVTETASPFASSLLFGYVGNFVYNADTPLAERRAHALALDFAQLRELLGDAPLRQLLDPDVVAAALHELQRLDGRRPLRHEDHVHDLLLSLGDLSYDELALRCRSADEPVPPEARECSLDHWLATLAAARRIVPIDVSGERRYAAVEQAARYRDALGIEIPADLPAVFLTAPSTPVDDLLALYARTHVAFTESEAAARWRLGSAVVRDALHRLEARGRIARGEFRPGGSGLEWCDVEVLRQLRQRSLAAARKQIEPVAPQRYVQFVLRWQGVAAPRQGLDALLDAIEQLQGLALPITSLEDDILPARVSDYDPADLDELCAAGEVAWRGASEGRVALYLADQRAWLAPTPTPLDDPLAARIRDLLAARGALFYQEIAAKLGGFPNDIHDALWRLVWNGELANDTLAPLRAKRRESAGAAAGRHRRRRPPLGSLSTAKARFRSRRSRFTSDTAGRWSLVGRVDADPPTPTERLSTLVNQLLRRHGIVLRETADAEGLEGGFSSIYPVLKVMEEAGRVRRGYFIAGRGASQFALAGADDLLRSPPPSVASSETSPDADEEDLAEATIVLSAVDPANPFGPLVPWPESPSADHRPQRVDGAQVFIRQGVAIGYLHKTADHVLTFDAADLPPLAAALASLVAPRRPVFLTRVDGRPVADSPLAPHLIAQGFSASSQGFLKRPT